MARRRRTPLRAQSARSDTRKYGRHEAPDWIETASDEAFRGYVETLDLGERRHLLTVRGRLRAMELEDKRKGSNA